jgi:uncharacterized protein
MARSLLLKTAAAGDAKALARLLDAGGDPNEKGRDGETPHMAAAANGRLASAELLLSRGAEADRGDDYGNTPLMRAAARGQLEMVRLLPRHGASRNHRNQWGRRAIDWSRWPENGPEIAALLEEGGG